MMAQTRETDLSAFASIAEIDELNEDEVPINVLIPLLYQN